MPKSPGRPKGSKDKLPKIKVKPVVLNGPKGDRLEAMLKETVAMTDNDILERAREITARQAAQEGDVAGVTVGSRKDEMAVMCYRLSSRGLSTEQIAAQLSLTVEAVVLLEKRLTASLKLNPKTLDVGYYMGESLAFFQEVRQIAMLASSNGKHSPFQKLKALEVALAAEAQKNAFLTKIGVYSPTVVERIERWVQSTTEQMAAPPSAGNRVNLAAAAGRALSRRAAGTQPRAMGDAEVITPIFREPS